MSKRTVDEIENWIVDHTAELLGKNPRAIDVDTPFRNLGLDSITAVDMSVELENWLTCDLPPTVVYDYPTIAKLSAYLVRVQGNVAVAAE